MSSDVLSSISEVPLKPTNPGKKAALKVARTVFRGHFLLKTAMECPTSTRVTVAKRRRFSAVVFILFLNLVANARLQDITIEEYNSIKPDVVAA